MRDSLFRRCVELYEMIWRMQTDEHSIGFVFLTEFLYDWANYIGYLYTRFPLENYTLHIKVRICSYYLYSLSNTHF
jgi:hypothetical protein